MNWRTYFYNGTKIHEYENHGKFSISKCYKALREPIAQVRLKRLLCNNKASPKSLFITWLDVLNKLATKTRLAQWNLISDTTCVLCNDAEEDIQHLFFNCPFLSDIWMQCLNLLGISRRPMAFLDEISIAASKCRRKSNRNQLYGMLFAEAIYNIWLQRNHQVFEGNHKLPDQTVDLILFNVACRIPDSMKKQLCR
ncbi:uncharacterized protein LOC125491873 [Beta vulgaris subsp. vulgaris]|uniref:uncharacterized protein LOC125491873 n=1 Tax=Beta vulgaris subsp. vulgaris TaxID=3555 RepID=UPI0020375BAC|nr:uncharacterized protein LOC125491873 [Beta vulgaris subsp. vulgaris]